MSLIQYLIFSSWTIFQLKQAVFLDVLKIYDFHFFCYAQDNNIRYFKVGMFLKIKFNGQIYLIRQSRVRSLQQFMEIVEKNFTRLPQIYELTFIDTKGNKKSLKSQETLSQIRLNMKGFEEIYISESQILNQLFSTIQAIRLKITNETTRANEKSNDVKKPEKNEIMKNEFAQQKKQITLRKRTNADQHMHKLTQKRQSLLNFFSVVNRPQDSREQKTSSNNESLDQSVAQNLAMILQISRQQAISHMKKYPHRNLEQLINIIMGSSN